MNRIKYNTYMDLDMDMYSVHTRPMITPKIEDKNVFYGLSTWTHSCMTNVF